MGLGMWVTGSLIEAIGRTPVLHLARVVGGDLEVWRKCEFMNPSGSLKDRIALYMIRAAERRGELRPG